MSDDVAVQNTEKAELDPKIQEIMGSIDLELNLVNPPPPNDYEVLFKVALEALNFFPPLYFQSIFGRVGEIIPPYRTESEYTILNPWRPVRAANYLVDITVPAFSHAPGPWARTLLPPVIQNTFWRPSNYFQQPDPFDSVTSFANERWFFLNGICTNEAVAKLNTDLISELFQRPITCIHNATDSAILDLVQCAVGKSFKTDPDLDDAQSMTEPAIKAAVAILEALKDPQLDKVVLLCHSEGTIITANVLKAFQRSLETIHLLLDDLSARPKLKLELIDQLVIDIIFSEELHGLDRKSLDSYLVNTLKKLEVYTFANCADKMTYVSYTVDEQGNEVGLPYIENFANEFDLVARLGVLSPLKATNPDIIKIDGDVYEKTGLDAWGHLLNQHYLFGMQAFLEGKSGNPYQNVDQKEGEIPPTPRLYQYYDGKRIGPYCK
ncbi:hypothetical protein [Litoribacillus peritrichatus]|uniref:Uncharacterized protein n=1 Tax=Litoribacillus peritrichatus TaxID=718191 RepID=A0ABP7MBK7_9GAMM